MKYRIKDIPDKSDIPCGMACFSKLRVAQVLYMALQRDMRAAEAKNSHELSHPPSLVFLLNLVVARACLDVRQLFDITCVDVLLRTISLQLGLSNCGLYAKTPSLIPHCEELRRSPAAFF